MDRRYFFKALASGLVAVTSPELFLPKLVKPQWKRCLNPGRAEIVELGPHCGFDCALQTEEVYSEVGGVAATIVYGSKIQARLLGGPRGLRPGDTARVFGALLDCEILVSGIEYSDGGYVGGRLGTESRFNNWLRRPKLAVWWTCISSTWGSWSSTWPAAPTGSRRGLLPESLSGSTARFTW